MFEITDEKIIVEQWFDGDESYAEEAAQLIAGDSECDSYLAEITELRDAARTVSQRHEIADAQFPAFMDGIRGGLERPPRRYRGIFAFASVALASLIVAVSIFMLMEPVPENVSAEVESIETSMEGAEVGYYESDDGTMTVWVEIPEGDVP